MRLLYAIGTLVLLPLLFPISCDRLFGPPQSSLELSVTVARQATQAKLTLTVRNISTQPVTLEFNTSQRFDFLAREASTQRLYWRWSFGKAFLRVLGRETFEPGAIVTFEAEMPYEGLPPTRYEIIGMLTSRPQAFDAPPVLLDLSEKPLPEEGLEILGEIPSGHRLAIRTLHGLEYLLEGTPNSLREARGFPLRAWLRPVPYGSPNLYELIDYFWVIAPLDENYPFIESDIRYEKSGGIAGMIQIIKIYGEGSFLIQCCFSGEANRSGFVRDFQVLTRYAQQQGFWNLKDSYGRPGVVADGFTESLTIRLPDGRQKTVIIYQDPEVEPPAAFVRIAERITLTVGLRAK